MNGRELLLLIEMAIIEALKERAIEMPELNVFEKSLVFSYLSHDGEVKQRKITVEEL